MMKTGIEERIADTQRFAPQRSMSTNSVAGAMEACRQDFDYQRRAISLDQLCLDEDLRIRVDGDERQVTYRAFDDLRRILGIPEQFARDTPRELFAIIVDRLGRLHQQAVVVVTRDDVVAGIVDPAKWSRGHRGTRPHFEPVTNHELLALIEEVRTDEESVTITICDAGIKVDITDDTTGIEPQVGDVIRVGTSIVGSETGGPAPSARGYTLRLLCANGATAPTSFGEVRFSTDWRVRHERRLAAFGQATRAFSVDMVKLRTALDGVAEGELNDEMFWSLYRSAAYIFRSQKNPLEQADRVLGVTATRRKELILRVRERQKAIRGRGVNVVASLPSGIRAWHAFNGVTAAGRDEGDYQRRVALERLGGDLLKEFGPQQAA